MSMSSAPGGSKISYRQQYRRCGKPGCSVCGTGGRGHGPYWYAYWTEGGRMRSRYLGKHLPTVVEGESAEAPPAAPTTASLAPLQVRTLGDFTVWRGAEPISPERWGRRKVAALFKCLLTAQDQRLHRDQVIDWLWPDADPAEGAHSLRTTMHLLRQTLEDPALARQTQDSPSSYLRTDGSWLALDPAPARDPDPVWLDALAFDRLSARALTSDDAATCRAALALYAGPYLPADVYADWAMARREALQQRYLAVLVHLADLCTGPDDLEQLEWCLRAALVADPCYEEAAHRLMTLLASSARRVEALQVYLTLEARLLDDLGVHPGRETAALYRRLVAQDVAPLPPRVLPAGDAPRPATNLPAALTSFVGREQQLAAIQDLLDVAGGAQRLVTLTGAGGTGKTRLGLQVATSLLARFPDGVWLVELAGIQPDLVADDAPCDATAPHLEPVARAVARALGVREESGRSLGEALLYALQPRRALLLLDNCEHLVAACSHLVHALLTQCPHLRILATSREALGIPGEIAWPVPPLALPTEGACLTPDVARSFDAVRLFLDRARRSRPDFALGAHNAGLVVEICRRLDGMPLAIELATARLSLLSLDGIAARLDDRFRLLSAGSRTALPRQQTLRATMDWSYALLTPVERRVLSRLATFAGGFTLEAAEALCAGDDVESWAVLDVLFRLVAKSLVISGTQQGEMRCTMLETVRQYAHEHLAAGGEESLMRERHCAWYLDLAERAARAAHGPDQQRWLDRLEREHDNLRLALTWLVDGEPRGDPLSRGEQRLRFAAALRWFWSVRGYLAEGWRSLDEARASAAALAPQVASREWLMAYATVVSGAGWMAQRQGDLARAAPLYAEAMALRRALGDLRGIADALSDLGRLALAQGDYEQALAHFSETLPLRHELGDQGAVAATLYHQGYVLFLQGRYDLAEAALHESLAIRRTLSDSWGIANALGLLGTIRWAQGDLRTAAALQEEALALYRQLHDRGCIAGTLNDLGMALRQQGESARARAAFTESMVIRQDMGDRRGVAGSLGNLGYLALQDGDGAQAVDLLARSVHGFLETGDTRGVVECLEGLARALWLRDGATPGAATVGGAADTLRRALNAPRRAAEQAAWEDLLAGLRQALGDASLGAAWRAGAGLTPEQALVAAREREAAPTV